MADMLAEKKKLENDEKLLIETLKEHQKIEKRLTQVRDPQFLLQLNLEKRKVTKELQEQDQLRTLIKSELVKMKKK